MRYLKTWSIFESKGLTKRQTDFLNLYARRNWSLNSDGLVDIKGNFYCIGKGIKTFEGIKFGKIGGKFDCSRNQLQSLEGAPKEVGGDFNCSRNQLQSLEGAPEKVGGSFNCGDNQLKSLEGAPQEIEDNFRCHSNQLKSLKGAPKKVGDTFDCSWNKLKSLEGAPKEVGGLFDCSWNKLESLKGSPEKVRTYFYCTDNPLQSLEGGPQEVGFEFHCYNNHLQSLEGAPKKVGGNFYCYDNPLQSLRGAPSEYKTIWWSEGDSKFIVPPFESAIEKGSMVVYSILNNPEEMDKLVDEIKKDLNNAPRILSIMRKNDPEFYERFKRRAEEMGVTLDTSADLGDLGF